MNPSSLETGALPAERHAIQHVAFFVYPVRNMAAAREFYEGLLGLKLENDYEGHWLEFNIQGVTFAITDWLEGAQPCSNGPSLALEVAHADSLFEFFQRSRVTVLKPLFDTSICRMGVIADPDGNSIIIHQAKII
jgi:predicted enzyme related to lactoylglutathione lyase